MNRNLSAKEGRKDPPVSSIVTCVQPMDTDRLKKTASVVVSHGCYLSRMPLSELLTLVGGAHDDEFRLFLAFFTLLSSATLEVNVSKHENVRRSQSLQNPSESAVISWPSQRVAG